MAWQDYDSSLINEVASQLESMARSLRSAAESIAPDQIRINQSLSENSSTSKGLRFVMEFVAAVTAAAGNMQLKRMAEKSSQTTVAQGEKLKKTKGK